MHCSLYHTSLITISLTCVKIILKDAYFGTYDENSYTVIWKESMLMLTSIGFPICPNSQQSFCSVKYCKPIWYLYLNCMVLFIQIVSILDVFLFRIYLIKYTKISSFDKSSICDFLSLTIFLKQKDLNFSYSVSVFKKTISVLASCII